MLIEIRRDVNRVTAFARDLGGSTHTIRRGGAYLVCVQRRICIRRYTLYIHMCAFSGKTALFGAVSPEGPCALSAASEEREKDKKRPFRSSRPRIYSVYTAAVLFRYGNRRRGYGRRGDTQTHGVLAVI